MLRELRSREVNGKKFSLAQEIVMVQEMLRSFIKKGSDNYIKNMTKCEKYMCKTLHEKCFFATIFLEACTQAINSVDTDCCMSDLYLEISSIVDGMVEKEGFPVMRVPRSYLKFVGLFFSSHGLWCK